METRSKTSFRPGFGAIFLLIAAIAVAVILGGTWALSRLTQQKLELAVKRRGSSLARQLASQLYEHLQRKDTAMLNALSNGILQEDDLRYVIVNDRQGNILVSDSRLTWRPMSMPNELRASVCRTADAIILPRKIGHEELYDIAVRLAPLSTATEENPQDNTLETVCSGTLHLGLSRQQLVEHQHSAQLLAWGISIFTLLSTACGYFLLRSMLINPLLSLSRALQKMPSDACRQALEAIAAYGEIDLLKATLLQMTYTHMQTTVHLQQNRSKIQDRSKTILEKNKQQLAAFEQQNASLYKLSEQVRKDMQSVSKLDENAQNAVEQSVSSLESTNEIKNAIDSTMDSIEDIRRQVAVNTERIVELGEKIAQITNVVKMINTIAAQTKLIAFNAGIEAAGAGESGGRFSIVAAEVRRLATTVVESVEVIKDSVFSIQTATSELILSSETGIRKVNQGVVQIAAIRETLHRMSAHLEEHSVSLNEVLESIRFHESRQRLAVNGIKDMSLQFEDALEAVKHSHEMIGELGAMVEELEP